MGTYRLLTNGILVLVVLELVLFLVLLVFVQTFGIFIILKELSYSGMRKFFSPEHADAWLWIVTCSFWKL